MRLPILFILSLLLLASPAQAEPDAAVYSVADVMVDVTSGNAALARELAIVQAQRHAFDQLMERLGAKGDIGKVPNEAIASFVQALEIQKEHAAGIRYTGTFAIQFKPDAVRNFLSERKITFVEARSSPVVVLPILRSKGRDILWEEVTPWHTAWMEAAKRAGLVPMIVPQSDIEDVAKIGAPEALSGKMENIQAMMQKYEATGVVVAVLQTDFDVTDIRIESIVDYFRYDGLGKVGEPVRLTIPPYASTKAIPEALDKVVRQIMGQMERGWRQSNQAPTGPTSFLPINVEVATLAEWAQIRNKMKTVTPIAGAHVVTMTRGNVHAEIEFRGEVSGLVQAMAEKGLFLEQGISGAWELKPAQIIE